MMMDKLWANKVRHILNFIGKRRITYFLFLFSLILNISFVFYQHDFYSPQTWENGELAENLVNGLGLSFSYFGNTLQPSSIMAPFYVFFLSFFYLITGITTLSYMIIQILQAFVQSLSVVLIFYIAMRLFNDNKHIAIISALFVAIFPDFIYGVTVIHQLTFTTFFIAIFVLYLLKLKDNPTIKTQIICGGILGVITLTEPTILFIIPFVVLWIFFEKKHWWNSLKIVTCILIIAILVVTPWTVRNYYVHDEVVPVKMSGFNFWRGNTPPATITGIPNGLEDASPSIRAMLRNSSEVEGDRILFSVALKYIKEDPKKFITSFLRKAYYFWWFPKTDESLRYQTNVLRTIVYTPLFIFTICGIFISCRRWKKFLPLYFLFISFTIGYALFFIQPRYRVPTVEPYMIIFASYAFYVCVINFKFLFARNEAK